MSSEETNTAAVLFLSEIPSRARKVRTKKGSPTRTNIKHMQACRLVSSARLAPVLVLVTEHMRLIVFMHAHTW